MNGTTKTATKILEQGKWRWYIVPGVTAPMLNYWLVNDLLEREQFYVKQWAANEWCRMVAVLDDFESAPFTWGFPQGAGLSRVLGLEIPKDILIIALFEYRTNVVDLMIPVELEEQFGIGLHAWLETHYLMNIDELRYVEVVNGLFADSEEQITT